MRVLLVKDVKSLGKAGEVKEVKDGYGQNFLIGKGLAKLATDSVMKQYEAGQRKKARDEADEIEQLKQTKEKLSSITTTIRKKLGQNGSLFGSITKEEIASALKSEHSIEIDKKHIELKHHIKATGSYSLDLKLGHSIHATLKIEVVGE